MKNFLVVLVASTLLAGCQLTRVEGEYRDVEVKVNTKGDRYGNDDRHHDGHYQKRFCPPGQAKKGNC
ncbi:hypothetical protein [Vibrio japonicus]|uniref:Lipoprotein n=1 Tax=Vibrio japonicus TaxID=1824638 RepID=A0ABY5LLA8_9VIBR|nr:hypothetical protein [Vibrio japonicus]UUM31563.1 hypothetical protein NP165_05375 [Vibrio japonicus]